MRGSETSNHPCLRPWNLIITANQIPRIFACWSFRNADATFRCLTAYRWETPGHPCWWWLRRGRSWRARRDSQAIDWCRGPPCRLNGTARTLPSRPREFRTSCIETWTRSVQCLQRERHWAVTRAIQWPPLWIARPNHYMETVVKPFDMGRLSARRKANYMSNKTKKKKRRRRRRRRTRTSTSITTILTLPYY